MKIKSSYLLAGLIALLVGLWMASGSFMKESPATNNDNKQADASSEANISKQPVAASNFMVSAVTVQNEMINRTIRANGVSEAAFDVTVSSRSMAISSKFRQPKEVKSN